MIAPMPSPRARLAVDIGGTFTDVAVEIEGKSFTAKLPTSPADPVRGVLAAVEAALAAARIGSVDVATVIHGTTLATNAVIERSGCTLAAILTEGFRDILEIGYERRYDQYDVFLDKPDMLVPRERCHTVRGRIDAHGAVLVPLDESAIDPLAAALGRDGVESVAVCFLHSYRNGEHERRARELLAAALPDLAISLSSEVSPEIREYDRLCTTVANAYVMPLMARYLRDLDGALRSRGFSCPVFVMTSGGGMTTLETAMRFPVRLVESGPSGGAILAARLARQCSLDEIVSFDMGGTTAKICLIDDGVPQTSRQFEIARAARFTRGSGLPVRIPVIEMIEIGAGGGSIASVDKLGRITVGPRSAGAEPGPAAYGRGGEDATVTDADAVLGYLDPESFAEGRLALDVERARTAVRGSVAEPLSLSTEAGAYGVSQIVDESMANAARIHAMERGKDLSSRTLVAFGGNGPLHATQLAEKVGLRRIVVPPDPGVGSAIGFLNAPISYEIVRSLHMLLGSLDVDAVNALFEAMEAEAHGVVAAGAHGAPITTRRSAFMRYEGQGHEIEVPVAGGLVGAVEVAELRASYERLYAEQYARHVPHMEIEIMNWAVVASTSIDAPKRLSTTNDKRRPEPRGSRTLYFGSLDESRDVPAYERADLAPGALLAGPALVIEPQTTTYVAPEFELAVDAARNLVLTRSHE
jgi:N-methylhydantoinase A